MADADFDDFDSYGAYEPRVAETVPAGVRFQKLVNGAGAATSVALIIGLGFWGYELAVRDVNGIPVIRALEGPARIAPENPGGELALHQGLAVNRIAADGTAADAAETLTLAPRTDGLADEDQPMGELAVAMDNAPALGLTDPAAPASRTLPASIDAAEVPVTGPAAARPSQPLPDGPADLVETDAAAAPASDLTILPASVPGVVQSPRPLSRPGREGASLTVASTAAGSAEAVSAETLGAEATESDAMAEAAAAAVAAAMAPPPALDISPDALAVGTRLVQIGAYSSPSEAELQWDAAAERYGSLFDGKRRVIEPATSGGQMFYRLRVEGFSDVDDARRFCAALEADNAECVPAVVR